MVTPSSVSLDFVFEAAEEVDRASLHQGDLLERTPELARTLELAHAYYATAADYSHFLVLTQSCDLVPRRGSCKARYITICAVRPLALAVQREFQSFAKQLPGFPLPVGKLDDQVLARNFLERILNNTVDGIFFVPKGVANGVDEHLCAYLALSIALRADHYQVCVSAKVAQATEIFAAKIGSLTSGLYARIATPDIAEKYGEGAAKVFRDKFFDEQGVTGVAWLSSFQRRELERALTQQGQGDALSPGEAIALLEDLPSEAEALADRAVEVLVKRRLLADDEDVKRKARNFLQNDGQFTRIARGS